MMLSSRLFIIGALPWIALCDYTFQPLEHLAGIAPYFEPHSPPVDPAPPQGCSVSRAAYLVRHAAIEANDFDYETYIEPFVQKLGNTSVDWTRTSPELSFLSQWKSPISSKDIELLTRQGKLEASQLGVTLSFRYPNLRLPQRVWASTAERTVKSAQSLIRGLEPDDDQINLVQVPEASGAGANSLTPYKSCSAYSSSAGSQQSGQYLESYTAPILARLRSQAPGFNWTSSDVVGMQELCGYETVIRGSSPFCSTTLFSPNEWLSFEYTNDLMYFYNTGYGSQVSPAIGYPWLNATMSLLTSESASQDLYVSFTHRELPPTVAVAMGLFNNSAFGPGSGINNTMPLDVINQGRAWQSSRILPFLGNVAIERLDCSETYGFDAIKNSSGNAFYRALWNNSPQQIPGCTDGPGESCSSSGLSDYLRSRREQYSDFSGLCQTQQTDLAQTLTFYGSTGNGTSVGK